MHISEGFLTLPSLAVGWAVTAVGVSVGLKRVDPDGIVRVAMASSVFFLASLINVRIPPASTHLSLIGPIGLLLGWSAFPAIFTALLLQAVLFQFGGLAVLGVNTSTMAASALCAHLLFGRAVRGGSAALSAAASFTAGAFAVVMGAALVGIWLAASDPRMLTSAYAIFIAHIPLAAIEGFAALFMTSFLRRSYPDILNAAERR